MKIQYNHKGVIYVKDSVVMVDRRLHTVVSPYEFTRIEDGKEIKEKDWALIPNDGGQAIRINEL